MTKSYFEVDNKNTTATRNSQLATVYIEWNIISVGFLYDKTKSFSVCRLPTHMHSMWSNAMDFKNVAFSYNFFRFAFRMLDDFERKKKMRSSTTSLVKQWH